MDLILRLRDLGLLSIKIIGDFGYNFFFTKANDWLPFNLPILGDMTLFEFTCLTGLTIWLVIKVIQWLV